MCKLAREIRQRFKGLEGEGFKCTRFRNSYLAEFKREKELERIGQLSAKLRDLKNGKN